MRATANRPGFDRAGQSIAKPKNLPVAGDQGGISNGEHVLNSLEVGPFSSSLFESLCPS